MNSQFKQKISSINFIAKIKKETKNNKRAFQGRKYDNLS